MSRVFAHRGDTRLSRENTLAAFVAARQAGADGVELDVHLSGDGVVVVHHDATVPGLGPIRRASRGELPGWLPTLEEALGASAPLLVNVEIKHEPAAPRDDLERLSRAVVGILHDADVPERFVVSSFSLEAIDLVKSGDAGVPTALLVDDGSDTAAALAECSGHGHGGLHPHYKDVDAVLVARARSAEVVLRPWTVNDPGWLRMLGSLGVEAVITDDVPLALDCMRTL